MTSEMARTTRVLSTSVKVRGQDAALRFWTEVLGCELRYDGEPMPGVRMIEVVPPGSEAGIVLLPPRSRVPVAVRLGTGDADEAFARVRAAGVKVDNPEVLRWEGVAPMFAFRDPEGNRLVYIEDRPGS
jgi:catechol 2,3-dioxygenase-like lactoylglutathione lyase family enzyme